MDYNIVLNSALLGQEEIAAVYTDVTVEKDIQKITVVNYGPARKIYLDDIAGVRYRVADYVGNEMGTGSLKELSVLTVPGTGVVFAEME